jgi:hypothetical protein
MFSQGREMFSQCSNYETNESFVILNNRNKLVYSVFILYTGSIQIYLPYKQET